MTMLREWLTGRRYNTPVESFANLTEVDCFLGGLIATGIPPQMIGGTTPAARVRHRDPFRCVYLFIDMIPIPLYAATSALLCDVSVLLTV